MQAREKSIGFALVSFRMVVGLSLSALVACGAPNRGGPAATGGQTGGQPESNGGAAGGSEASGGSQPSGGVTQSAGGSSGSGGTSEAGGVTGSGGATASGGVTGSGGATPSGGATGRAGASGAGGATGSGGTSRPGGAPGSGGSVGTGGATGRGGGNGTGGGVGVGGAGGASSTGKHACDIYDAAGFPCVAAHSTVRALYAGYTGPLYQVRKSGSTKDIPVGADGYVNIAEQDSFCAGGGCTISLIYDQSPNKNHLPKTPDTLWMKNSKEANATDGKVTVSGHTAYGVYFNNPAANVGYRNNNCKGVPKNDEAEAMYMVLDGKRYTQWCCFDYGNGTTTGQADGPGTMETIYWGSSTQFNKGGAGAGPWVEADLEYGMFACDTPNTPCATNTPVNYAYVTAMVKGPSGNSFGLKAGNAQSGKLETKWDGKRPPGGYAPKKLGGQIILGTGGDGSNYAVGTFYEGAMTKGNPPNSVDDEVQADIVAAGYGK
jgi:hypothetical protein